MIVALITILAKQERICISKPIKVGLDKSRQQGCVDGRPTFAELKITKIKQRRTEGLIICSIAQELKISRGTVYHCIWFDLNILVHFTNYFDEYLNNLLLPICKIAAIKNQYII